MILNKTQLTSVCDDDEELRKDILDLFIESLNESIYKIEGLLLDSSKECIYAELKFIIHDIKGSSGNIGAEDLHLLCKNIEMNHISEKNPSDFKNIFNCYKNQALIFENYVKEINYI